MGRIQMSLIVALLCICQSDAIPTPFPLPANLSWGVCGYPLDGPSAPPECFTGASVIDPSVTVECSTKLGCTTSCSKSSLFQQVLVRYKGRLTPGVKSSTPLPKQQMTSAEHSSRSKNSSRGFWWSFYRADCDLMDLGIDCGDVDDCKTKCEANPDCFGFNTHGVMKNSSCAFNYGPLPCTKSFPQDCNVSLYLLRDTPTPQPPVTNTTGSVTRVQVCVTSPSEELGASTDESYSLMIPSGQSVTIEVNAKTIFGAMHGLETLTQLTSVRANNTLPMKLPVVPVTITDAPQFSFRGLMIDSGRHFLPVNKVKSIVDGASLLKLNVIHWHLVDSQSFASGSETFPELAEMGAYPNSYSASTGQSPSEGIAKQMYSVDDMKDVVAYAKARGVRIQPEWDMPGHGSWGFGKPELMTSACSDALDVTRPELYDFLLKFLSEMGEIFEGDYMFLGGDELDTSCFDNSPSIAAWMKAHGLNSQETQQYFWQQMTQKVFPSLNKTISVWEADGMQINMSNLPKNTVANVYQSISTAWQKTVPAGINTVVSMAGQHWYLDGECGGYNWNAWTCIYSFTGASGSWLANPAWTAKERSLFLGGETAIWGEGINTDNFDSFVWHGAAAAAERLWTTEERLGCPPSICPGIQPSKESYWMTSGNPRMTDQMCRMSRQGIKTGPIYPGFCPSDGGDDTLHLVNQRLDTLEKENAELKAKLNKLMSAKN
eukprot:m.47835 g.47835  ORF g.47835 m.47835 type:complete len:715 (+) comp10536_c0_seq2:668-2812(+)